MESITFIERERVAEGTEAFRFSKPAGFTFKAGQAVDLVLPGDAGRHAFSIVSAPSEDRIEIATRMRDSEFKRALRSLEPGAAVHVDGPFGSLTLHANRKRAAVLVAGGIGITPFVSMLRHAAREEPRAVQLVYANRRRELAAYLGELEALARADRGFRLKTATTIDAPLLANAGEGLANPIWYVVGPPGMVEGTMRALESAGVADEDVRTESFYGYEAPVAIP
jgi:ferredoxin-NADP reductase